MKDFYVTFGFSHEHYLGNNYFDRNCVAVIQATRYITARNKCFALFGRKFCFIKEDKPTEQEMADFFPRGFINVE